jgi:SAM-dependent methyltransferase
LHNNLRISEQNIDIFLEEPALDRLFERVCQTFHRCGVAEPYWSVLTDQRYRAEVIDKHLSEFYETGEDSVALLLAALARNNLDIAAFKSVLEFGCGVGRVTVHLADRFARICAVDISEPHLDLCRAVAERLGKPNIEHICVRSFSTIDALAACDVLYSVIVLQHNPPPLAHAILRKLLRKVRSGGIAYFQLPVFTPGYRYDAAMALEDRPSDIEQHVLPQRAVFNLLSTNGFDLLEALPDTWLSPPHISCSFLAQRR